MIDLRDLFDADERELLRSRVVEFWAGTVAPSEIARRIGLTHRELAARYGRELSGGWQRWTGAAVILLYRRARAGYADAALLALAATQFDHPALAALLSQIGEVRH